MTDGMRGLDVPCINFETCLAPHSHEENVAPRPRRIGHLAFGVMVMNALIGMKGTPPVKPRIASARLVKTVTAEVDTLAPSVHVEGRVQALNRMTVLSEVNEVLPVGGKEFEKGFVTARTRRCFVWTRIECVAGGPAQPVVATIGRRHGGHPSGFPRAGRGVDGVCAGLGVEAVLPDIPRPATDRERLYLTSRGIVSGYRSIRANEARLDKFTVPHRSS